LPKFPKKLEISVDILRKLLIFIYFRSIITNKKKKGDKMENIIKVAGQLWHYEKLEDGWNMCGENGCTCVNEAQSEVLDSYNEDEDDVIIDLARNDDDMLILRGFTNLHTGDSLEGKICDIAMEHFQTIVGDNTPDSSYSIGFFNDVFAIYYWADGRGESFDIYDTFEEAQEEFDASRYYDIDFFPEEIEAIEENNRNILELNEFVKNYKLENIE